MADLRPRGRRVKLGRIQARESSQTSSLAVDHCSLFVCIPGDCCADLHSAILGGSKDPYASDTRGASQHPRRWLGTLRAGYRSFDLLCAWLPFAAFGACICRSVVRCWYVRAICYGRFGRLALTGHLTPRWSGCVIDKVPSSNIGVRAAQLNRWAARL